MTKTIFILLVTLFFAFALKAQSIDTTFGYFDNDKIEDTIYKRFVPYTEGGPYYLLHLVRGCGETHFFEIGSVVETMFVLPCGKGCIETFEWKAGGTGFKTTTIYRYDPRFDDWLEINETTVAPGTRTEVIRREVPMGISGREYPELQKRRKPRKK